MNEKRRLELNKAFEDLQSEIIDEREALDNQQEYFEETDTWQVADKICTDAENIMEELEEVFTRWEIR